MSELTGLLIYINALSDECFTKLHSKRKYDFHVDEDSYYKGKMDAYNELYRVLADIRDKELGC